MKRIIAGFTALVLSVTVLLAGCGQTSQTPAETVSSSALTDTQNPASDTVQETDERIVPEGYSLSWEDNFDGDTIDETIWNRFAAQPGWVNNELQEYTTSPDNAYTEDGKLVIRAIKNGVYYTSARLTTQGKKDIKYGYIEARVKLPSGKGLWPAFWMMASDEGLYGQWPKCGEIDIMECLGNEPSTVYGTIHYGEPHASSQGVYKLASGSFSDDYHIFAVEWTPAEIRYYVDGQLYHTVNDWFTKVDGMEEVTYPAPFDQPFHIIMNLAVGGDWPGNPDASTDFENAKVYVDYVRCYQQDSYDENVQRPAKEVLFREADSTGNLIINGDLSQEYKMDINSDWKFLTFNDGVGSAEIKDGELVIETEKWGTEEYSVQVVQPGLPIYNGSTYRLSFDARATADRTIITNISAPDRSWKRYLPDTKISLTPQKQSFSYEFTFNGDDDPNGRLEFNLGKQRSAETVIISNVRLEETQKSDAANKSKPVLPDGNYIYNGAFQSGENRMGHWTVSPAGAKYDVTNENNVRELVFNVTEGEPVTLSQDGLSLAAGVNYALSFDICSNGSYKGKALVNGQELSFDTNKDMVRVKLPVTVSNTGKPSKLELVFEQEGEYTIDNVRINEDALLINGSFASGLVGWVPFVDGGITDKVSYLVDSLSENNAVVFNIGNTGDVDWKIQLKQEGITLEKGKSYQLTFDAKCSMHRKIKYAFQRDGNKWSGADPWLAYSPAAEVDLTTAYQTYTTEFTMEADSDIMSMLSFSMGAIDKTISEEHKVFIDNVTLIEK